MSAILFLIATLFGTTGAGAAVVMLYPVQDRTGDSRAAAVLENALRIELANLGDLVGATQARDSLRRLRLRNGDQATPADIRRLRDELSADWLVAATLHDAERLQVPRVTVSARVYDSRSGELIWAGFQGSSGLDRRKLLGFGVIEELEVLVPVVVGRLMSSLLERRGEPGSVAQQRRKVKAGGGGPGRLAIVPFSGVTSRRALASAETATEAARAAILEAGLELCPRYCVDEVMRVLRTNAWGGVDTEVRQALRDSCGAAVVLTGAVERYDVGGGELEPEPHVTVALRLLDAETGHIVWTDALERRGWGRQGLLRLGRIHSRGELTEKMLRTMTARLIEENNG